MDWASPQRPAPAVASPETSAHFRALHAAHGAVILEDTGLDRILGETAVTGVRLKEVLAAAGCSAAAVWA